MSLLPRWALIPESLKDHAQGEAGKAMVGSSGSLWVGGPLEDGFSNSGLEREVANGGGGGGLGGDGLRLSSLRAKA